MKFKHDGFASSVTYDGKEHEVDEDGLVDLPADAAEHIAPHGFKPHVPISKAELEAKRTLEKQQADVKKKAAAAAAKFVKQDADEQLEDLQKVDRSKAELEAIAQALADSDEPSATVVELVQKLVAETK